MLKSRFRFISFVLFSVLAVPTTADSAVKHYCPYFKNRAPSPQSNLENCTWFRENSCCLNHELSAIFSVISTPLQGASQQCTKHTNFLMCYVCAPNQETFYEDERLTVCEEFCDRWYGSCKNAIWKGFAVGNLYKSGAEFCEERKFLVASKNDNKRTGCYTVTLNENFANSVSTSKVIWTSAFIIAFWTS